MANTENKKDCMNIKEWADKQCQKHREEIKYYISGGIETSKAVEMVLGSSVIGSGYKAQIRYEFKGYKPLKTEI